MSRYKNPPKEVCMVRTLHGDWLVCEANEADMAAKLGHSVAFYDLRPETETETKAERPRKTRKKTIVGVSAASAILKEVEANSPMPETKPERKPRKKKGKSQFRCVNGHEFDELKERDDGVFVCPHCGSLNYEPLL